MMILFIMAMVIYKIAYLLKEHDYQLWPLILIGIWCRVAGFCLLFVFTIALHITTIKDRGRK